MSALLFLFGINRVDATEPSGGLFMYGADGSIVFDITSSGNLEFGTTTGSKIGTATDQKLSFYNATPIIQPSGDVLTALSNLGLVSSPTLSGLSASAVGTINLWASSTVPDGWILCDGASLLRTGTYAGLFAVIGTTYGSADGTHFNVPNFKGKVPVGYNSAETEFDVMGETGGEKTHTLSVAEMPAHTHALDANYNRGNASLPYLSDIWSTSVRDYPVTIGGVQSTGGNGAHNNLQPYLTLNYIIKYAGAGLPDSGLIVTSPISGSGSTSSPLTVDLTRIKPASDSTTAVQINKADGTTNVLNVDTTNSNVGIGTTAPKNLLHIRGSGTSGQVTAAMILENLSSGTLGLDITGTAGASYARFLYGGGPGTGTNGLTSAMNIVLEGTNAGKIGIGTEIPSKKLDVSGEIRTSSGILFGTDTATANTLNDYEEGTWTPIMGAASGNKTPSAANSGWYIKIGKLVTVGGTIAWSGGDALSGNIEIKGLPFTSSGGRSWGSPGVTSSGVTLSAGYTYLSVVVDPGNTFAYFIQSNGASYSHTPTIGTSGTIYGFGATYRTD